MTKKEMVSLDYFVVALQKKCDAVAGLKVQVSILKNRLKDKDKEIIRLESENIQLASKLTELNHDYQKLVKKYEPDENEQLSNDFHGKIILNDVLEDSDD